MSPNSAYPSPTFNNATVAGRLAGPLDGSCTVAPSSASASLSGASPSLTGIALRSVAPFNASLAAAFGGYPSKAVVADPTTPGVFWVSTADNNLTTPGASGASWQSLFVGLRPQSQVVTAWSRSTAGTYTYTVPAGCYCIRVRLWGGSGGGGGSSGNSGSGAGGGAGAYCEGIYNVTPGQTIQVVVGAGGAKGSSSGGSGGNGIASSVQGLCTAGGGSFAGGATTGPSPNFGYGGQATGGTLANYSGQTGQAGQPNSGGLGGCCFSSVQGLVNFAAATNQVLNGLPCFPLGGGQGGYGPGATGAAGTDGAAIIEGL